MEGVTVVDAGGLPDALAPGLRIDGRGRVTEPLILVDLNGAADERRLVDAAAAGPNLSGTLIVGFSQQPLSPRLGTLGTMLTTTVVPENVENEPWQAGVPDVDAAVERIVRAVARSPIAARTLAGLLPVTEQTAVPHGLLVESLAYSMLLSGPEFARWLADRGPRPAPDPTSPAVLLSRSAGRDGDVLTITLNRPRRHNALDRSLRDGLVDALEMAAVDPKIVSVRLVGAGASFCSGGDLDEFGSTQDPSLAHVIRVDRSVAERIHQIRVRVTVELHGAAIGAGIELASHAARVTATPDTHIALPELAMGLIPGAGGTVGITKRIGRWRTAYFALSGEQLPLHTALRWGLVDAVQEYRA
jgi:enoyl-CoA hydratase/carnithine racemase